MTQLAARTGVSDTYPLPSNGTAKTALGLMYDVLNESTQAPELDLASSATTDIGGQLSRKLRITGTTGITSFGTTYTGPIILRFSGAVTITHNATSLICPGSANLSIAAGDILIASPKCTTSGTFDGWVIIHVQRSGGIAQTVRSTLGTVATGTTIIPLDNTIPQNNEGDQYLSVTITPHSATSILVIEGHLVLAASITVTTLSAALFQDAIAGSICATSAYQDVANAATPLAIGYSMLAGTISPITFKIRAGLSAAGTLTINGLGGGQLFGGVANSYISVTEYLP